MVPALAPNDVWSIDYKGWFRVGDGTRCDPLTLNDVFSRMSLECRAMVAPKLEDVQFRLEALFWLLGLPRVILSDNGPPFGSRGLGGLSRLDGVLLLIVFAALYFFLIRDAIRSRTSPVIEAHSGMGVK